MENWPNRVMEISRRQMDVDAHAGIVSTVPAPVGLGRRPLSRRRAGGGHHVPITCPEKTPATGPAELGQKTAAGARAGAVLSAYRQPCEADRVEQSSSPRQ
jgi:hypothetical protein